MNILYVLITVVEANQPFVECVKYRDGSILPKQQRWLSCVNVDYPRPCALPRKYLWR